MNSRKRYHLISYLIGLTVIIFFVSIKAFIDVLSKKSQNSDGSDFFATSVVALAGQKNDSIFIGIYEQLNSGRSENYKWAQSPWIQLPETNIERQKVEELIHLSDSLISNGDFVKGIETAREAVDLSKKISELYQQNNALKLISKAYRLQGELWKYLEIEKQRLSIAIEAEDIGLQTLIMLDLSSAYVAVGDIQNGIRIAHQSVTVSDQEYPFVSVLAYIRIAKILEEKLHLPSSSVAYYKRAVNKIEEVRALNIDLPEDQIAIFLGKADGVSGWSDVYVGLADRLLKQKRVMEALIVLDLLKSYELQDFFQESSKKIWQDSCKKRHNFGEIRCINFMPQEEEIFESISSSNESDFQKLDHELTKVAPKQNLQIPAYLDLKKRLSKLGKNSALFYPLILEKRLELVLFMHNSPPISYSIPVSKNEIKKTIAQFRAQISSVDNNVNIITIQQTAQQLYRWFIEPVKAELEQANIQTLIYAPDGQMRYVPLAALYNGSNWLVEKYKVNYITALNLTDLDTQSFQTPSILAGAFTDKSGQVKVGDRNFDFGPIPAARKEIETLAQNFSRTKTLTGSDFNRKTLSTQKLNRHNIVHLATHGQLVAGSPEDSFILLNNGEHISLREIKDWQLPNVGLVVLSACQTALGDQLGSGIEIIGFGYQLQLAQARAAIATLWSINDTTTSDLMDAFYKRLKQDSPNPVDALQKAQIDLITSSDSTSDNEVRSSVEWEPGTDKTNPLIGQNLAHPYYWAPFILIGNGL
ncbi:CHAT domain-containing protein [Acaryochloris marina NIES-2412]|uniref:CHAT domain-containing protein n=1 Tax=Acaryochloris marina TaxID=155978 RepID=UPI004059E024